MFFDVDNGVVSVHEKIRFKLKKQIPKGDFGTMQNLHFS